MEHSHKQSQFYFKKVSLFHGTKYSKQQWKTVFGNVLLKLSKKFYSRIWNKSKMILSLDSIHFLKGLNYSLVYSRSWFWSRIVHFILFISLQCEFWFFFLATKETFNSNEKWRFEWREIDERPLVVSLISNVGRKNSLVIISLECIRHPSEWSCSVYKK